MEELAWGRNQAETGIISRTGWGWEETSYAEHDYGDNSFEES